MEPFIGQIQMFGFNFAPRGWAFCNGQLLPISSNSALFSLLGTDYGGDGRTTFGLPDLRGRFPTHLGTGPGLSPKAIGQKAGVEEQILAISQMPQHSHLTVVSNQVGDQTSPVNGVPAVANDGESNYRTSGTETGDPTGATGGNVPVDNLPPFLVINFSIALVGIFPSRS